MDLPHILTQAAISFDRGGLFAARLGGLTASRAPVAGEARIPASSARLSGGHSKDPKSSPEASRRPPSAPGRTLSDLHMTPGFRVGWKKKRYPRRKSQPSFWYVGC